MSTPGPWFRHTDALWAAYPELVAGVLRFDGVHAGADTGAAVERHLAAARTRLAGRTESELPEIAAWRRVFARMGLKPTQYRCASEALLRRLRMDGGLPRLHPLVDLANAVSAAFAIPVAVFDLDHVGGGLVVGHATGEERYETFGGDLEQPPAGEVVFRDDDGWAHARRWTNRQSGRSAVRAATARVLVVAEAVHAGAAVDVPRVLEALQVEIAVAWGVRVRAGVLSAAAPAFPLEAG